MALLETGAKRSDDPPDSPSIQCDQTLKGLGSHFVDRPQIVRTALESWFEPNPNLPITRPCTLHALGRTVEVASEEYRTVLEGFRAGFPDVHWRIRRLLTDGEWSTAHADLVGTHLGRWNDLDPTHRRVTWEHMLLFRFDGDLIADVWEVFDRNQITEQLTANR